MTLGKKLIAVACLLAFASGADARPVFPKLRAKIDAKRGAAKPTATVVPKVAVSAAPAIRPLARGGCATGNCPLR